MPTKTPRPALLLGGRIRPLGGRPAAGALLVAGGRVAALGTEAEVRAAAPRDAEVVDLAGATVTPGITDAHTHPTAWALGRRRLALHDCASLEEILERVGAAPGRGWILGQGWSRHVLGEVPDRRPLDRVAPERPVLLESRDIHAAWVNGAALRLCGITRDTPDPPGGEIVRDPETGEPTGMILEEAKKLVLAHVPVPGREEILAALEDAQCEAHRWGITGMHSVEPTGLEEMTALLERGRLRLRILQHLPLQGLDEAIARGARSGAPHAPGGDGEWIRIGGIKMFLDGALGSRTALLREPYVGEAEYRGIETLSLADFRDAVRRAAAAGLASTVHAIGDAAVERALDVLGSVAPPAALPHRVEHLQLCPPDLWDRVAASGVVASMQPVHLLTDVPAAEAHWGHERSRGAYAFAPLLRRGVVLAFGSDVPVETADPRPGLFAATRRETWGGPWEGGEWYEEHRLTAAEALSAYTEGPALAAREAGRRGRLLPGFDADLAAWNVDPLEASPPELLRMRCRLTMVAGEIVHRD
jgi:hypothetical protein